MTKTKITPLYEKLSRDDELQGESNFISNLPSSISSMAASVTTSFWGEQA